MLVKKAHLRYYDGFHLDLYETEDNKFIEVAVYSGKDYHKNIISVSNQIGCPVKCNFCTEKRDLERNISANEFLEQVTCAVNNKDGVKWYDSNKGLKVAFTRAGEALLNINYFEGLKKIEEVYHPSFQLITILPDTTISNRLLDSTSEYLGEMKNSYQMVISMHTSDEDKRSKMIVFPKLMSFEKMGKFGEKWVERRPSRKVDLSFALMDNTELNFVKLRNFFHPDYFAIRFSVFRTDKSSNMGVSYPGDGFLEEKVNEAKESGYDCVISRPGPVEKKWNILQGALHHLRL